jgi:hypothetical protein
MVQVEGIFLAHLAIAEGFDVRDPSGSSFFTHHLFTETLK